MSKARPGHVLVLLGCAWAFLGAQLVMIERARGEANASVAVLRGELGEAESLALLVSQLEFDLFTRRRMIERDLETVFEVEEVGPLAAWIRRDEVASGVEITNMSDRAADPATSTPRVTVSSIALRVEGTFDQTLDFVHRLERFRGLLLVRSVQLRGVRGSDEVIEASIEVDAPIYREIPPDERVQLGPYESYASDPQVREALDAHKSLRPRTYDLVPRPGRRSPIDGGGR